MLEDIDRRLYTSLPDDLRPVAQKWFYVLNPRLSWTDRKRPDEVDRAFVERFFEDRTEYDRYEREFAEGVVTEACMSAASETPEGHTVFDAHRKDCLRLYALVRKFQPSVVVETGVYNGVSTLSTLAALAENGAGQLHSVDYSRTLREGGDGEAFERERPSCSEPGSSTLVPGEEPGWIVPERLRERWSLRQGHPRTRLPALLGELGSVDLFVHDSAHTVSTMLFEFELAWEHLTPGGMVLSSHVQWNDAFETFVEEHDCEHGLTTFHYLGYEGETVPCSTGYVLKPGG
jgi:hypothetical protein